MMTEIVARQYTRDPKPVEAIQLTPGNIEFVAAWCDGSIQSYGAIKVVVIDSTLRNVPVYMTDYVLKHVSGVFSACPMRMFETEYTRAIINEKRKSRKVRALTKHD